MLISEVGNLSGKKNQKGFTLIELTIVILIFSILIIPLLMLYSNYIEEKKRIETKDVLQKAQTLILTYYTSKGSYPCPSDLSKGMGDADFGIDYCGTNSFATVAANIPLNTCLSGGGICRVAGSDDADGDGNPDPILIGGVPFASIAAANLQVGASKTAVDEIAKDGWNGMVLYAVSQNLTNASYPSLDRVSNGFVNDYKLGVVTAKDEFGHDTAGINGDAHFSLISHGPDNVGAYSIWGNLVHPCDLTRVDGENCDNDGTFIIALGNYDSSSASHYDDISFFKKIPTGELWVEILNNASGEVTGSIRNMNTGNVGVLTNTPEKLLDVNGEIKTPSVLSNVLCKPDGTGQSYCLPRRFLTDDLTSLTSIPNPSVVGPTSFKNRCTYAYQASTGIWDGKINCSTVSIPADPPSPIECDSGYYVTGIRTDGCIYCSGGTSPKCP